MVTDYPILRTCLLYGYVISCFIQVDKLPFLQMVIFYI